MDPCDEARQRIQLHAMLARLRARELRDRAEAAAARSVEVRREAMQVMARATPNDMPIRRKRRVVDESERAELREGGQAG